jgi:flagellar motor component MotA
MVVSKKISASIISTFLNIFVGYGVIKTLSRYLQSLDSYRALGLMKQE